MTRPFLPLLCLTLPLLLAGCESLRGTEPSKVSTSQTVASAYWFRGVPRSLEAVTYGDLQVDTPLTLGGNLSFVAWYNLQLTNDTGDAVFPDGNGGQNTEIDLLLDYTQTFGPVRLSGGGVAYGFPNEVGPSTKEAFVTGAVDALGLSHALSAYYDVDRIDDFYFSYQASRGVVLDEQWNAALAFLLGYMGEGQGEAYFGAPEAGFSDLLLSGSLTYHFDRNTSVFLKLAGVTVPDDDLADALSTNGLDDSGFWVALGAAWGL